MAYHFHLAFVSRGKGQSLVAKGAYQARDKFREERTGETKDYTHKQDEIVQSFVFVDKKHGPELQGIESLLNAIDRSEDRANAQTALNFTGALPKELSDEERARMVRDFGREHFLRKGIPAIAHIHPPHEQTPTRQQNHENGDHAADEELHNGNWHVHILAATRTLGPDGQFGDKYITWRNYREFLEHKRERWAELGARYLENAGYKIEAERWRYGHLTNPQQREKALERGDVEWAEIKAKDAGKHRGPNVDAMERKDIETDLGNAAREIQQHNEDRTTLHALKSDLARLERQDAFENLKAELTKADRLLSETRRAKREPRPPNLEELNSQIFHALLHEAIRHPGHLDDVQLLAWRMPGNFVVDLTHAVAEIEATRHLGLNDLAKLINQRERHSLDYQRAELDALKALRSPERASLSFAEAENRMDAAQRQVSELDPTIYNGLLSHLIRATERLDEIQIVAWRLPDNLLIGFQDATEAHERVRNLELADIKKLVAEHERQESLQIAAETEKMVQAYREREYAKRDPVREQIAWEDAVAKAAIEKEKIEQRFLAKEDREKETRAGGKQAAPELGKTQAQIRLARALSPGPQSFANALEDRGFTLARVTPDDIQRDTDRLRTQWEERHRNPQTWMEYEGGYAALAPELKESARRSFEDWQKRKEQEQPKEKTAQQAKQFAPDKTKDQTKQLENYVQFVQKKWREAPKSQLERAAGGLAVVTQHGGVHILTERNTGMHRDELPQYLKGIDRRPLLTVTDAQAAMQDLQQHREQERQHSRDQAARPELAATQAHIRLARVLSPGPQSFANALEDRGLILACMTEADAERLNRWEAKRLGKNATYKPGQLAVVNQYGDIFQITPRNTGLNRDELPEYLKGIDRAPLLSVSAAQSVARAARQHQWQEKQEVWERKRAAAAPKFGDILLSHTVKTAMRDPRQQHGEPVPSASFRDALEQHRLALACVTPEEASKSYKSYREAQFAKELERDAPDHVPVYQAGEIVIVREPRKDGNTVAGRVHKLDQTKAEDYLRCLALDKSQLQSIEATKQALDERAQNRQRAIDAANLRKARGPRRGGLAAQEKWAMRRVRETARKPQPYHPEQHAEKQRRREQEYRHREDSEKRKRDAGDQIDAERYRTDPEYRRQVQQTQEWKSPEDKQRDRENAARAFMEQQDRGR